MIGLLLPVVAIGGLIYLATKNNAPTAPATPASDQNPLTPLTGAPEQDYQDTYNQAYQQALSQGQQPAQDSFQDQSPAASSSGGGGGSPAPSYVSPMTSTPQSLPVQAQPVPASAPKPAAYDVNAKGAAEIAQAAKLRQMSADASKAAADKAAADAAQARLAANLSAIAKSGRYTSQPLPTSGGTPAPMPKLPPAATPAPMPKLPPPTTSLGSKSGFNIKR